MNYNEIKIESSMPVQSRIDLKDLAKLVEYWENNGVRIDTMSKLVSWSISTLKDILILNGKISSESITLQQAYDTLVEKGLIQQAMFKKMKSKLNAARALENIRLDGWEVNKNLRQYKELHKPGTVECASNYKPSDEDFVATMGMTRAQINELVDSVERKSREDSINKQKEIAYANPKIVKLENECSGKDIGGGILIDKDELMQKARANDEALKNF